MAAMGGWEKVRMAGYLGLAIVVGYLTASEITLSEEPPRTPSAPAGITASTNAVAISAPQLSYGNCDEAWAAGAAPIYKGESGYAPRLDRDNDGVACEPYYGPVKNFGRRTAQRRKSRYSAP